jgi:hypothetical protein
MFSTSSLQLTGWETLLPSNQLKRVVNPERAERVLRDVKTSLIETPAMHSQTTQIEDTKSLASWILLHRGEITAVLISRLRKTYSSSW